MAENRLIEMGNYVYLAGKLSEVTKVRDVVWSNANGEGEAKACTVNIRVNNKEDEGYSLVPVDFFVPKYTKAGAVSKPYDALVGFLADSQSIAEVGEEQASNVNISYGRLTMEEFYGRDGNLVRYPKITASFINIEPMVEHGFNGTVEIAVIDKQHELDEDGVETGVYTLMGATSDGWNAADVIPFKTLDQKVATAIEATIEPESTVKVSWEGDFTFKKETITEEALIGDPIERTVTTRKRDLMIKSIGQSDNTLTEEDILAISQKRASNLEKLRLASEKKKNESPVKEVNKKAKTRADLGF